MPGLLGLGLLTPGGFYANDTSMRSPPRVRAPPKRGTVLRFGRGDELTEPDTSVLSTEVHTTHRESTHTHNRARREALSELRHVGEGLKLAGTALAAVVLASVSESCEA